MTYFLFHKPKGAAPDYIRAFRSEAALEKYIRFDIAMLKCDYPKVKWSRRDYMVAVRL